MKAELLSVGTELLLGTIVDTNAAYLGQELATLGIDNYFVSAAGDNLGRLSEMLRLAWNRSDLIVVTGGVGPTEDDLTREAIAALLNEPMVVDPDLERDLRAFFRRRGVEMPERNVKQATLIRSATAIPNPVGTAPGWFVERDGRIIVSMPGVPTEMKRMWSVEVKPRLKERAGGFVIVSRTLKIIGIGESAVEERLGLLVRSTVPTVATYAKRDGIHVRLTTKSTDTEAARSVLDPMDEKIRGIFGGAVYGVDDESLAQAVSRLLVAKGWKIAIAEEGTAGLLTTELAQALPSDLFAGSAVRALDPEGWVVGEEHAKALAEQARSETGSDVGVGLAIGVISVEPPSANVYVGIADAHATSSIARQWNSVFEKTRQRGVNDAIMHLRERLAGAILG